MGARGGRRVRIDVLGSGRRLGDGLAQGLFGIGVFVIIVSHAAGRRAGGGRRSMVRVRPVWVQGVSGVETDGRLHRLWFGCLGWCDVRWCDVGLGRPVRIGRVAGVDLPEVGRFFGRNIGVGCRLPLQGAFEPRALTVGHADAAAQFFSSRPFLLLHTVFIGLRGYGRMFPPRGGTKAVGLGWHSIGWRRLLRRRLRLGANRGFRGLF